MAGGITLADAVPTIADGALLHLSAIRDARSELRGATAPLNGIIAEVNTLMAELALVKELTCLQTDAVRLRTLRIMHVAEHLSSNMLVMAADSRHFADGRELEQGGAEWSSLETNLGQLRDARRGLEGAVEGIHVGLYGNEREGYRVSRRQLVGVNDRVKGVMGMDLALFLLLRFKIVALRDDVIKLDDAEAMRLGLPWMSSASVQDWRTTVGI